MGSTLVGVTERVSVKGLAAIKMVVRRPPVQRRELRAAHWS